MANKIYQDKYLLVLKAEELRSKIRINYNFIYTYICDIQVTDLGTIYRVVKITVWTNSKWV